jgi:hypothetical protein
MKRFLQLTLPIFINACGPSTADYRQTSAVLKSKQSTVFVETMNDLPACTTEQADQRVYVKDLDLFRVCIGNSWVSTDILEPSANQGVNPKAVAFAELSPLDSDLCLDQADVTCTFEGGDLIRYWDGSLRYRVSTKKTLVKNSSSRPEQNLDTETGSLSMLHEAQWDSSQLLIMKQVMRLGLIADVFLQYQASSDQFAIYFDSNGDAQLSSDDELLFKPTLFAR